MTNLELIERHKSSTGPCSFFHMMREHSETYSHIMEKGREIVPDILQFMVDNPDRSGMSIILLLMDITKEHPYVPERAIPLKENEVPTKNYMASWNVKEAVQTWIAWGKEKELICPECGGKIIDGDNYSGVKCSKCDWWFCY